MSDHRFCSAQTLRNKEKIAKDVGRGVTTVQYLHLTTKDMEHPIIYICQFLSQFRISISLVEGNKSIFQIFQRAKNVWPKHTPHLQFSLAYIWPLMVLCVDSGSAIHQIWLNSAFSLDLLDTPGLVIHVKDIGSHPGNIILVRAIT